MGAPAEEGFDFSLASLRNPFGMSWHSVIGSGSQTAIIIVMLKRLLFKGPGTGLFRIRKEGIKN